MSIKSSLTTSLLALIVAAAWGAFSPSTVLAQGSNYFPGSYATFGVALAPNPGFVLQDWPLIFSGSVDRDVRGGEVNLGVDEFAAYNLFAGLYTFDTTVLGGRFAVGGWLPIGYVNVKATRVDAQGGSRDVDQSEFGIGDMGLIPANLFWSAGSFSFNVYEVVYVPTGEYDATRSANIGLNMWTFDTSLATTYLNAKSSTEVSAVAGVMVNTKNTATQYREGSEFHLDYVINQYLSDHWAIGLQGYYYNQFTADTGSGALLGAFQGEAVGLGPALLWMVNQDISLSAKWIHDLDATNRVQSDWITVAFAWIL